MVGAGLLLLLVCWAIGCANNRFERPRAGTSQRGLASWYGEPFHGRATASGEIYDMHGMTAAHKELPLGTVVHVHNLDNGREVTLRVNDRGPFVRGRILDVSHAAAKQLKMIGPGTARIELRVVEVGGGRSGPIMTSRYTVQLGAFRQRANAEHRLRDIQRWYPEAAIISRDGLHRLRVGTYRKAKEAERVKSQLKRRGYDAVVIGLN